MSDNVSTFEISGRVKSMDSSPTFAVNNRILELIERGKKEGFDVYKMTVGEPDLSPPKHVIDAVHDAMKKGMNKYGPAKGLPEFRKAISKMLYENFELGHEPESEIAVCDGGAKIALSVLFEVLIEPGEHVVFLGPCWDTYVQQVRLAGGIPLVFDTTEDEFKPNVERVRKYLDDLYEKGIKPKLMVINTPNNPTGAVYPKEVLKKLSDLVVRERGIGIISDEAYATMTYGDKEHFSIASYTDEIKEKVVTVGSFAKSELVPGWRIGYICAGKKVISAVTKVLGNTVSNPPTPLQYGLMAALSGPDDYRKEMHKIFGKRRELVLKKMDENGILTPPLDGAFYSFFSVDEHIGKKSAGVKIESNGQLANMIIDEAKVGIVPGTAFPRKRLFPEDELEKTETNMRLSYASGEETIEKAIDAMGNLFSKLEW